jgi:L-glyceraldehyde 3-phosphate reductase
MNPTFSPDRYKKNNFRRCGRSGLMLPPVSLGAWQTFGGYRDAEVARECLFGAFDLGVTHFDLANNYGTPPGNAEIVVGQILKSMPRDELIISSKAGYTMWPGPYGDWGSRKYLIASCDQSLRRTGLEYFDIFYHHRPDPQTPLEETLGALDTLVKQGKALYVGVSNYSGAEFNRAVGVAATNHLAPLTIHQPYYNMLSRTVETDLLPQTARAGTGVIAFCPLAQGLLTSKFLGEGAAEARPGVKAQATPEAVQKLRSLNEIARDRGQTLAQMALAWLLRLPEVTSALIGASSLAQIQENVAALDKLDFSTEELARIDELAPRSN